MPEDFKLLLVMLIWESENAWNLILRSLRYGELEPFGREDTAQELTDHSVQESDEMVDQLERAEVRRSVPASRLSPCVFCMFRRAVLTSGIDQLDSLPSQSDDGPIVTSRFLREGWCADVANLAVRSQKRSARSSERSRVSAAWLAACPSSLRFYERPTLLGPVSKNLNHTEPCRGPFSAT